ncbi:hypothetical protein D3C85_784530 [compost metagenome]
MLGNLLASEHLSQIARLANVDTVGRLLQGILQGCDWYLGESLGQNGEVDSLMLQGKQHVAEQVIGCWRGGRWYSQGLAYLLQTSDRLHNRWQVQGECGQLHGFA